METGNPLYKLITMTEALYHWYEEGRRLPGYRPHNGAPYICYLLDVKYRFGNVSQLDREHPGLMEAIAGPNGWAILQMLIARKGLKDETTT